MPKNIYNSLSVAHIITKSFTFITNVGKSATTVALVATILITSFWAHTAQAETISPVSTGEEKIVDGLTVAERAAKIDAYFGQYNLPAAGYGKVFVMAADREGIDWKFVAAKAMIESTGGKFVPKKDPDNMFGWGCSDSAGLKCKDFASKEEAINEVTAHLAGNRQGTAKYYKDKTLSQKMSSYNKVNPKYQPLVFGVMDKISKIDAPKILAMK
jgi:hypothetical protein